MAADEKTIYVFDDFSSHEPMLLGTLRVSVLRGTETYSFEYDASWLSNAAIVTSLDPELSPYGGRQYSKRGLFGAFADAAPDRWGRMLMNKRELLNARRESRKPAKLYDVDYLLGVSDATRMGGLRFKSQMDGPFLSDDESAPVPPWTTLRALEEASRNLERNDSLTSEKWLARLMKPGSSLGGARPKATVMDESGELWIAKFPSKHDENDAGAWEMVVHDLALGCNLNVPEATLKRFSDFGSTYLVKRFDRENGKRVHFASAMTLLGKKDGASAADGSSYLDIVEFIRGYGANPRLDLIELWRRIVFSMAVSNTDDHLRNHAFLFSPQGWALSPQYDVNPVPFGNELSLNVDAFDNSIDFDLAIKSSRYFGIQERDAAQMTDEISGFVAGSWEKLATQYGISRGQIEAMRPAFVQP